MTVESMSPSELTPGPDDAPGPRHVPPARPRAIDPRVPRPPRGSPVQPAAVGGEGWPQPSPRAVIADHHPASRFGIRVTLEHAGFLIVAEAATGEDATALATAFRPDVCLLDIEIPGGGIATARAISARAPGTAIVVMSAAPNEEELLAAIVAGATGYLPKTIAPDRLPIAVRAVVAGEAAIPRAFVRRLAEEVRRRGTGTASPSVDGRQIRLTPREAQVVELMREGMSTREIGARLGISDVTVRRHVSTALRKLEAPDRQAAVRLLQEARTASRRRSAH